jgi:thymidine kinase
LGPSAGASVTTGNGNVCVGNTAGSTLNTGTNNIMIGLTSKGSAASNSHEIVIGANDATGKGGSTALIDAAGGAVYAGNNSANFSTTSDRRIKKNIVDNNIGLEAINQVRVRNFEYRTSDEIDELPKESAIDKEGTQLGVIAQEIQQILPDVVNQESTGCLTVDPDNMTWYLVNAVKQLSAKVEELEEKLNE